MKPGMYEGYSENKPRWADNKTRNEDKMIMQENKYMRKLLLT